MATRKKSQPKTPAARQEALKQTLITEIVTILNENKTPVAEKMAAVKLTAQQKAAVDSLNQNDFGCQRKQVIHLVSAIVGKDLSNLVNKEGNSDDFKPLSILKWVDNKNEVGIGLKKDSDDDIGFIYIDSEGDKCFDWVGSDNFKDASIDDLVKTLNAGNISSVSDFLSDITETLEENS